MGKGIIISVRFRYADLPSRQIRPPVHKFHIPIHAPRFLFHISYLRKDTCLCFFLLIGIWAIMLLAFNKEHLVYISGSSILNGRLMSLNMIGIICYRYIIGFLGSVGLMGLLKRAHTITTANTVFEYLGKNTMAIYCFQIVLWPLFFRYLGPIVPTSLLCQILISSLMIVLCLCLSAICRKTKVLNVLFLGNR